MSKGDPAGERRGRTARGKRVPGVEINDQIYKPSKKTFQLISEIRSHSVDCLPSLIKASVCGVSASQFKDFIIYKIVKIHEG
ncbi:hypothetical protein [Peribacillus simplex]|uniref:hypothetical protein n=1 Tax=Peribacillus simplex TaxID=1478 RepID=UPI001E2B92E8|nr:hypothetical protein [Peribacillus simplex]